MAEWCTCAFEWFYHFGEVVCVKITWIIRLELSQRLFWCRKQTDNEFGLGNRIICGMWWRMARKGSFRMQSPFRNEVLMRFFLLVWFFIARNQLGIRLGVAFLLLSIRLVLWFVPFEFTHGRLMVDSTFAVEASECQGEFLRWEFISHSRQHLLWRVKPLACKLMKKTQLFEMPTGTLAWLESDTWCWNLKDESNQDKPNNPSPLFVQFPIIHTLIVCAERISINNGRDKGNTIRQIHFMVISQSQSRG